MTIQYETWEEMDERLAAYDTFYFHCVSLSDSFELLDYNCVMGTTLQLDLLGSWYDLFMNVKYFSFCTPFSNSPEAFN